MCVLIYLVVAAAAVIMAFFYCLIHFKPKIPSMFEVIYACAMCINSFILYTIQFKEKKNIFCGVKSMKIARTQ